MTSSAADGLIGIKSVLSTAFSLLSSQNANFDYVSKGIESGKSQAVAGFHSIVQVAVAPKDHPDQIENCEVDMYENTNNEVAEVTMKCEKTLLNTLNFYVS